MFFAIILIILGLFLLLNAMGIIVGNFWGFFWAIVFILIGLRMMMKRGNGPMCGWREFHGKMHEHCECDHEHDSEDHH